MIHSESTDEELFRGMWNREQYARVLLFNIVAVCIESVLVAMFILWLGNLYWGNWFENSVLIVLPFFCYGAVLSPILGVWLWMCLLRIKPARRHWASTLSLTAIEFLYACMALCLSWGMLHGEFPF